MTTDKKDNGVYYYLGSYIHHVNHALPLYRKLGGTFVVSSIKTQKELEQKHHLPVICIDNINPLITKHSDRIRVRIGKKPQSLILGKNLTNTFKYLEKHAKVVLFYELFSFTSHTKLHNPTTLFLTHGNMLKSYMSNINRLHSIKDYDYMAGLGPLVKKFFIDKDGMNPEQLINIGIARTDELFRLKSNKTLRKRVAQQLDFDQSKKIISYIPTFWGPSSIYNTGKAFLENINDDFVVLFQPHPQTSKTILKQYQKVIKKKPNIIWVGKHHNSRATLTDILCASDLVIGDVSSVILEAILLDKPLVFAYDIGEHRQSMDDYKLIPEIVEWSEHVYIKNAHDINSILSRALQKGISPSAWRKAKNDTFYHHTGDSVDAIIDFIQKID